MPEGGRRLAAIMFTDIVGYTALGQENESLALSLVEEQRNLLRPIFERHVGREVKTIGDAFLVEFPSALNAVRCAYEIQKAAREFNSSLPEGRKLHLRIGVHLGDVVESHGDISGDAVNVASRIESLADDGGVCLTRQVYDHVENKFERPLKSMGPKPLKNVKTPLEVYRMQMPWEVTPTEEVSELDRRRVAVLPLRNMSPDPNDEYLSDGMTEELITALSGVSELTVIARTSIMQYKNSPKRVIDVGKELRTGTVIEGSVRKASNKVRITIQMVDVGTEGHLWAQNYDRQMDDIFAIQSEVAEKVADVLKLKLIGSEKRALERRPTENTEAYTLYLKGRYYWNERTSPSVEKGIAYLQKAIQADPNLAPAYSDLADAYIVMGDYSMMPSVEAYAKSREYAAKALSIDPNLSQPHAALAATDESWTNGEREFKLAIELNPNNATAHHWLGVNFFFRGKEQSGIEEYKKAKELDPLSPIIGAALGYALVRTGKKAEGLEMLKGVLEMNDTFPPAHTLLAFAYIVAGLNADAVEEARKLLALSSDLENMTAVASVYAMAGLREEAIAILDRVLNVSPRRYVDPASIARAYAALGDKTNALEWLERGVKEKSGGIGYVKGFPQFDSFHDNPRFRELTRQAGLE